MTDGKALTIQQILGEIKNAFRLTLTIERKRQLAFVLHCNPHIASPPFSIISSANVSVMHMNANDGFQPKHRYLPRLRSNNLLQLKVSSLSRYINYDVSLLHHSNLNRITITKSTAKSERPGCYLAYNNDDLCC